MRTYRLNDEFASEFCEHCGNEDVEYYNIETIHIPSASGGEMPVDLYHFYCEQCVQRMYEVFIEEIKEDVKYYGDTMPSMKEFLNLENIYEL